MPQVIRVTDETSTAKLRDIIAGLNHQAKREMPAVGTKDHPTPWDLAHDRINAVLDDLLAQT